jgi:hypothetical protein
MRTFRTLLLAGGAALMLTAAAHADPASKSPPCPKPDGAWSSAWADFGFIRPDSAFSDFDRLAEEMEQRLAAMMRRMDELERIARTEAAAPNAAFATGAPMSGVYGQSVVITQTGDGPPQVVRRSWGDCGGSNAADAPQPNDAHALTAI